MNDILISSSLWITFLFSLIPITWKVLRKNIEPSTAVLTFISSIGSLSAIALLFYVWPKEENTKLIFSSILLFDSITAWGSLFLLAVFICITIMNLFHPQVDKTRFSEILFLQQGSLLGLLLLLWSNNLLSAFIALETASLCFYMLIALGKTGPKALISAFKYFILGSVAAVFFLYGIAFILGAGGNMDLQSLLTNSPELFTKSRLLVLGFVFILIGILFKVSIFPFHFWLPDVYKNSFTPLLVLMATGVKITLFCLLFKWTKGFFTKVEMPYFLSLLQWLAVLSVLFGNIIALLQKDFKKMLLFSTIAHSGYLLMIMLAAQMEGVNLPMTLNIQSYLLYYLMVYAVMTIGIFICIYPFESAGLSDVPNHQLKGLAYKSPIKAGLISLFLLSLAGIPPTGGFIAKFFVFHSLINQGLWWLVFWTILGSSLALYYYLKPLALMYMEEPDLEDNKPSKKIEIPLCLLVLAGILALLIILCGIFPNLFQIPI